MLHQALHLFLVFALSAGQLRQLTSAIMGYVPGTDVTQHNAIDKDQKALEDFLGESPPNFANAKAMYNGGANSGAYARITVGSLAAPVTKSSAVVQENKKEATGSIKKDKAAGVTEIDVSYTSTCISNSVAPNKDESGCYTMTGGALSVGSVDIGAPSAVKNKYRTLAGFSTAAEGKMKDQRYFEKFKAYYTHGDYAHRYVTEALDGTGAFAGAVDVAREQGVKKGSAYMNVWMYVIREMEDAYDDCKAACATCNDDSVHAWDEAVAFYTGSLEDGAGSGKMLYALANKRCTNFQTCGANANSNTGNSNVNIRIFEYFNQGKAKLSATPPDCEEVLYLKDEIVKLMTVPLIQGALRYAYKVNLQSGGPKEKAEGAVFSAAVLPMIHACNPQSAALIENNMKIDSTSPMVDGFSKVKAAFEATYSCLGITCADVGGLIVSKDMYMGAAKPCGLEATANSAIAPLVSAIVQLVVASGLFFAICGDK